MSDFKREQHETAGIIGSAVLALVAAMEARLALDTTVHPSLRGWGHGFELQRRATEAPPHRVTYCVRFPGDGGEPPGAWQDTVTLAFRSAVERLRLLHAGEVRKAEEAAAFARTTEAAIDAALKVHGG